MESTYLLFEEYSPVFIESLVLVPQAGSPAGGGIWTGSRPDSYYNCKSTGTSRGAGVDRGQGRGQGTKCPTVKAQFHTRTFLLKMPVVPHE